MNINEITVIFTPKVARVGGLCIRSPQIYLPGGLATTYDAYFVNVHYHALVVDGEPTIPTRAR
jgi:hypothetical protein